MKEDGRGTGSGAVLGRGGEKREEVVVEEEGVDGIDNDNAGVVG